MDRRRRRRARDRCLESAKPLYAELCRAVWRAGGHVLGEYLPDDDDRVNLKP